MGVTSVEAEFVKASDVTGRFDTGHAQVNFSLFPPENIKMIRGNIVAEERSYLSKKSDLKYVS